MHLGISLYHVLVASRALRGRCVWEARPETSLSGTGYICLTDDLCHGDKLKAEWLARRCQFALSRGLRRGLSQRSWQGSLHVAASSKCTTGAGEEAAGSRRKQSRSRLQPDAGICPHQAQLLWDCLMIVWLLLQTLAPLSYFIVEYAICYTAVSLEGIILGG